MVPIPTNKGCSASTTPIRCTATKSPSSRRSSGRDIKERHEKGQPILVGTASVENSEYPSRQLAKAGVRHEVLNAKNNEREAAIVAQAGQAPSPWQPTWLVVVPTLCSAVTPNLRPSRRCVSSA